MRAVFPPITLVIFNIFHFSCQSCLLILLILLFIFLSIGIPSFSFQFGHAHRLQERYLFYFLICSLHTGLFSPSHNRYQSGNVKANWHLKPSKGIFSKTHSEENAICPLQHTWTLRPQAKNDCGITELSGR